MEESKKQIREMVAYLLGCERTTDKETIDSYTDTIMAGADKYAYAKFNHVDLADISGLFSEIVTRARQSDLWDGHEIDSLLDDLKKFNEENKR